MNTILGSATVKSGVTATLWSFKSYELPELDYRSRGPAPSYGSGPYFRSRKRVTGLTINGSYVDLLAMHVKNDGDGGRLCRIGKDGVGTCRFLNASGGSTVAVFENTFDSWKGNTMYFIQKYYYMGQSAYPFPTTLEGWISNFDSVCDYVLTHGTKGYVSKFAGYVRTVDVESGGASFDYKNDELNCFCMISNLDIFPREVSSHFSAAYVSAVESLDLSDTNTLLNIKEAVDGILTLYRSIREPMKAAKELVDFISSPRKLATSGWLKYRYQYLTTKMDLEDYQELCRRLNQLTRMVGKRIKCTGFSADATGSYYCTFWISVADVLPKSFSEQLAAVGIEPTPVNVWDAIPYSFIMDWFFHVSDILDYWDKVGNTFDYSVSDCWFAYHSSYDGQSVYYRVPGRRLSVPPKPVEKHVSSKTLKMRVADTVSLVLGR